jgi:O-antigen/teichoic acid export membrane protein
LTTDGQPPPGEPSDRTDHARSDLAVGIVRLVVGRALSVVLNFLGWAFMARALGPDDFGIVQFGIAVMFYVSFVTDLGLTTLGTRDVAASSRPGQLVRAIMGLRLLLAVIATIIAVVVALAAPVPAQIADDVRMVALILSSTIAAGAINGLWLLRAQGRASAIALQDIASAFVLVAGAVLLVRPTDSVALAAATFAAAQWLAALLSLRSVGGWLTLQPTLIDARAILRRALPLGVAALAVNVYYTADSVLLGILRDSTEVGLYGAAYRLVTPWLMLASVAGLLAMPTLARLVEHGSADVEPTLRGLSRGLLALGIPVAAATSVAAGEVLNIVFGPAYAGAALPLALLIWTSVTVYANAPFGFLLLARHEDRRYMWIAVAGAVVNLSLNAVLIPTIGMAGAAIATLAAEVVVLGSMIWFTRDVSFGILARSVPPAVLLAALTAVAVWPVRESGWVVPVGLAVFGVGGTLLGVLPTRMVLAAMGRAVHRSSTL